MPNNHTTTIVQTIPDCELCPSPKLPAYADASLPMAGGSWGNVCKRHFNLYGASLGLGRGQRFVFAASQPAGTTPPDTK